MLPTLDTNLQLDVNDYWVQFNCMGVILNYQVCKIGLSIVEN